MSKLVSPVRNPRPTGSRPRARSRENTRKRPGSRRISNGVIRSISETRRLARRVSRSLLARKRRPIILALSGALGSGKTAFAQGLAAALGIRERIQSPTFVLMKWYGLGKKFLPYRHLVHVDAYRIARLAEARHLGLPAVFSDRDAIVVVEWAERIRKLVPRSAVWVQFKHRRSPRERIFEFKMQNAKLKTKA